MALKAKVFGLAFVWTLDVVVAYATTAFNRPGDVPFAIAEHANRSSGELQATVCEFVWVPIIISEILWQTPYMNESILMGCD